MTVEDGGLDGFLSTAEDNATTTQTFDVVVNPVNDTPTLDVTASPSLIPVAEDAAAPVGPVGTRVSDLLDSGGSLNNFSDVDGDSLGIAIVGVNVMGGSMWVSTDDGLTWQTLGAVSEASPRLLPVNETTRIYLKPGQNFSGTIVDAISFKAWDRTGLWQQIGADIDGEAADDWSGGSVSMSADGQTVAIGATSNDGNGSSSGHVRVYRWAGLGWSQLGADIDGEAIGDDSGYSVSMSADGEMVAIGALYNDGNGAASGHVSFTAGQNSAAMEPQVQHGYNSDRILMAKQATLPVIL